MHPSLGEDPRMTMETYGGYALDFTERTGVIDRITLVTEDGTDVPLPVEDEAYQTMLDAIGALDGQRADGPLDWAVTGPRVEFMFDAYLP